MDATTTEERREKVAGRAAAREVAEVTEYCSEPYREAFYQELLAVMPIHLVVRRAEEAQK